MLMGGVEDRALLCLSQPPLAGEGHEVLTGGVEGRAFHKNNPALVVPDGHAGIAEIEPCPMQRTNEVRRSHD